jgi:Helix-turn-helix domain
MSKQTEGEQGSGNVFADIGLLNPEERLAKADLAIRIAETIQARRLTQTRAPTYGRSTNPRFLASCVASFPVSPLSDSCTS